MSDDWTPPHNRPEDVGAAGYPPDGEELRPGQVSWVPPPQPAQPTELPPIWAFASRNIQIAVTAGILFMLTRKNIFGVDAHVQAIVTSCGDMLAALAFAFFTQARARLKKWPKIYWLPKRRSP